jgi:hypothetical protein
MELAKISLAKGRCALMGCKLKKGTPTLKELIKKKNVQARILLEMGFEPEDKFCEECFWK